MKKLVLGMVFCGFAALVVGCGDTPPPKKDTTTPVKPVVEPPKKM